MSVSTAPGSEVTLVTYLEDNLHSDGLVERQGILVEAAGTYERPTFRIMRLGKDNDFSALTEEILQSRVMYLENAVIGDDHLPHLVVPEIEWLERCDDNAMEWEF